MNSSDSIDQALRRALGEGDRPRDVLKEFSRSLNRPLYTLYALSEINDPFVINNSREEGANWFADIWRRLDIPIGYHYRRIHYRMISQASPLAYFRGGAYENTQDHWNDLNIAARDAVALRLIPGNAFVDRRNPRPLIFLAQPMDSQVGEMQNAEAFFPPARFYMPFLPRYGEFLPGIVPQEYHIEIWAEKSTMNDILVPLAQRYQANLITGVGELSYTQCRDLIARFCGRRVRIIYITDFDPAGQGMSVAVARKIEYEIYLQGLADDVQVRPIILTHAQCVQYQLPRTPLKDSEPRAAGFEKRFGEGATELDALEAIHPGEFRKIVEKEIERYWNPDHDQEVQEQFDDFKRELDTAQHTVYAEHQAELEAFRAEVAGLNAQLQSVNRQADELHRRMKPLWITLTEKLVAKQPIPWIECPWFDGDEDDDPLFDSSRNYIDQMDAYKDYQGKPKARKVRQPNRRLPPTPTPPPNRFRRGN